jgi:type 1 fimbria pilin
MQLQTFSKALLATAAGSLFALGAAPAFAQDTATLAVKGSIVPAACSANFAGGDTVDFGTIKVVDLKAGDYNLLGTRDTSLNVTCSSAKTVTFELADQQAGSRIAHTSMANLLKLKYPTQAQYRLYGLGTGMANGAPVNLGSYRAGLNPSVDATVDGITKSILWRSSSGGGWTAFAKDDEFFLTGSFTAGTGSTASTGTSFVFPMQITAGLNKGSELQVAQDTPLNGQIMFTINYQ